MRISFEQVTAICTAAAQVVTESRFADQAIQAQFKSHTHWSFVEQGFIAEQIYALVRYYRLLEKLSGKTPAKPEEWEHLLGTSLILQRHPAGSQFQFLSKEKIFRDYQTIQHERALRESIPDWLDELGQKELGEQWTATLHALNEPPALVLRVNTLKTDPPALLKDLAKQQIYGKVIQGNAVLIEQRGKIFSTPAFRQGWFEVQDFSSQQVAPYLEAQPGMRVIDACAGNGGKTLHLAALMQNKGRIIALDTDAKKLEQLRLRARRAGISIVETRQIESSKTIKRLAQSADRVLLDVPCSGLGVLRRNPEIRWRLSAAYLENLRASQQQILERYSKMCRPGAKLVYATCSVLPSENQQQVETFMNQAEGKYSVESEQTLVPQATGYDGFYMARLVAPAI